MYLKRVWLHYLSQRFQSAGQQLPCVASSIFALFLLGSCPEQ